MATTRLMVMGVECHEALSACFQVHCEDQTTMAELTALIEDKTKRRRGHDLFQRIRKKTLGAERSHDHHRTHGA